MYKTYAMLKPGFTEYYDEVEKRVNEMGAKITHKKEMMLNDEIINRHYAEHIGKPFFNDLKNYMLEGKVVGFIIESPKDTLISDFRQIVGATKNPAEGTIRHDFGIGSTTRNVIHASDSPEAANREIGIFFPELKNEKEL